MFLGRSWFGRREFPWRKLLFPRLVIAGLETMRSFVWVIAGLKTLRSFVRGRMIRAVGVNPESVRCNGPCTKTQVVVREDLSQTLICQIEFSP